MSDLKQDLTHIAAALPGIPGSVDGLHQEAHALGDAVADLVEDLGDARGELRGALSNLSARLAALEQHIETLDERVQAAGTRAEGSWNEAREGLQAAGDRIDMAAQGLEDERLEQEREAEESASRVKGAWAEGEQARERLSSAAREGQDKIEAGVEASRDRAETLRGMVEEARAMAEESARSRDEALDAIAERTRGQALYIPGEMLFGEVGGHQRDLQSLADAVGARASLLREQAEAALHGVLTSLAAANDGTVATTLSFTAEAALTSPEGAETVALTDQRSKLQGTLQLLNDEAENLPAVMHEVEISAQLTGLP